MEEIEMDERDERTKMLDNKRADYLEEIDCLLSDSERIHSDLRDEIAEYMLVELCMISHQLSIIGDELAQLRRSGR